MKSIDYWRLCEELTVTQASLLIVGEDPSSVNQYVEQWELHARPEGYEAVKMALKSAVLSNKIESKLRYPTELTNLEETTYREARCETVILNEPDWHSSTILVDSLKKWLKSKGIITGFFFPNQERNATYLDKGNPYYAPKLAIAIMAWEEVTDNTYLLKNKTPKKAIEAWLETNATKFNLSTQAIGEIAKIANWNTKGGAPSTPLSKSEITTEIQNCTHEEELDELPF